jgi:hypothetical protein
VSDDDRIYDMVGTDKNKADAESAEDIDDGYGKELNIRYLGGVFP